MIWTLSDCFKYILGSFVMEACLLKQIFGVIWMNLVFHGPIILSRLSGLALRVWGFVLENGTWVAFWAEQMPPPSSLLAQCWKTLFEVDHRVAGEIIGAKECWRDFLSWKYPSRNSNLSYPALLSQGSDLPTPVHGSCPLRCCCVFEGMSCGCLNFHF